MSFQKTRNIEKLEESIGEKNTRQKLNDNTKNIKTKEVITKKEDTVLESPKKQPSKITEEVDEADVSSKQLMKLLNIKTTSTELPKKRTEHVSVRVSDKTFNDIKKITSSGILSQADLITVLVEKYVKEMED